MNNNDKLLCIFLPLFVILSFVFAKSVQCDEKFPYNFDEIIPSLIIAGSDEDKDIRFYAIQALGNLGQEAKDAVPFLIESLHDPDIYVKNSAIEALGKIGPAAIAAIDPLLKELRISNINKGFDMYENRLIAVALTKIDVNTVRKYENEVIPVLLSRDNGCGESFMDTDLLVRIGSIIIPYVIEDLKRGPHEQGSFHHLEILSKFGPESKDAVPILMELEAIETLGAIGPDAREAIPLIIESLKSNDYEVSDSASAALLNIGSDIVPYLIEVLNTDSNCEGCINENECISCDSRHDNLMEITLSILLKIGKDGILAAIEEIRKTGGVKNISHIQSVFEDFSLRDSSRFEYFLPIFSGLLNDPDLHVRELSIEIVNLVVKAQEKELKKNDPKNTFERNKNNDPIGVKGENSAKALTVKETDLTDTLIEKLKSNDENIRNDAIVELGTLGKEAQKAVPVLSKLLYDEKADTNIILETLGKIGSSARDSVPAIIEILKYKDIRDFVYALEALIRINVDAPEAVPVLIEGLSDKDVDIRKLSAKALMAVGPDAIKASPALLISLSDEDVSVRLGAADVLQYMGVYEQKVIDTLIPMLSDKNAPVLWAAITILQNIGPSAENAVDELKALYERNSDNYIRRRVIEAISKISPRSGADIYISSLESTDFDIRKAATISLGKIGPDAIPILIELLNKRNGAISVFAADSLVEIGNDAIPSLLAVMNEREISSKVIRIIGKIYSKKNSNLRELFNIPSYNIDQVISKNMDSSYIDDTYYFLTLMNYASQDTKDIIAETLLDTGIDYVPVLEDAVNSENEDIQSNAKFLLEKLFPTSKYSMSELIESLDNEQYDIKRNAIESIVEIGTPAIPLLTEAAKSDNINIKCGALEALSDIDPISSLQLFVDGLSDENSRVRMTASVALMEMGPDAEKAIPSIVRFMEIEFNFKDQMEFQYYDGEQRRSADILAAIGKPAMSSMIKCLKSKNKDVRKNAVRYLYMVTNPDFYYSKGC